MATGEELITEHRCPDCGALLGHNFTARALEFELRRHQYGHDKGCLRDKETQRMTRRSGWTNRDVYYVTESPLGYAVTGGPIDLMAMPIADLTDEEYEFVVQAIDAGREAVEAGS